jgi:hypothetical protein
MLVQQTSRLLHQQNKASLLLKLDITKAFDSVSWPFLIEVMRKLGFGQIWRDLICGLLATSSTQILLNGFLGRHIKHRKGLRQGDPSVGVSGPTAHPGLPLKVLLGVGRCYRL